MHTHTTHPQPALDGHYFVAMDSNGAALCVSKSLNEAVQNGIQSDGYHFDFLRDERGVMHIYLSNHIGNNPYAAEWHPEDRNIQVDSSNLNDDEAKSEIFQKMAEKGSVHKRWDVCIEHHCYSNNRLVSINDVPVESE